MDWLYALIALVLLALTAPLWPAMLRSARSRRGGGAGPVLSDLNAFFDPSQRHVERVSEERVLERREGEPPLPLDPPGR